MLHVRHENLIGFSESANSGVFETVWGEEGGLGVIQTRAFFIREKNLMPYSIQSWCVYCFCH